MARIWMAVGGHSPEALGFALSALEQLAAGDVAGARVEVELWANRQLDQMTDMGWIEVES